jgi:hypothetical protein
MKYHVARSKGGMLAIFAKGRRSAVCVFTTGETDALSDLVGAKKNAEKICGALNIMDRAARSSSKPR